MKRWTLHELARHLGDAGCRVEGEDRALSGLAIDSRLVSPGELFSALPGTSLDGRAFIDEALDRGAAALLLPESHGEGARAISERARAVPSLICARPRRATGRIAQLLAGDPSARLLLLGVTGTNGKSTCAHLLQHLMSESAGDWGVLGTLHYATGGAAHASTHTTPDSVSLARLLAESLAAGQSGLAMEVSSHALDQDRVAGCHFGGVLLTNLSRDHLDYHGSMAAYLGAKAKLLDLRDALAPALVNADDPSLAAFLDEGHASAYSFGGDAEADYRIESIRLDGEGARFRLSWEDGAQEFASPLPGDFNVHNAAGCLALALRLGLAPDRLARRLASFPGLPGRMETLALSGGPRVIIDFAHSPDAVRVVLGACRSLRGEGGRIVALLGAGGDRDRGKRPLMGAALQAGADLAVLTSDNPRSEDPELILDDMEAGMDRAGSAWFRESDRARAIRMALSECEKADVLVLLGKGHERSQEIAGRHMPFDDREEVEKAWRKRGES